MSSEGGKYVPPNKRPGFKEREYEEPKYLFSGEVTNILKTMGWVPGAGGQLYFNGNETTDHPHLHLSIGNVTTDYYRVMREKGDVRRAISMVAWSDGKQGQGGGGITFIADGKLLRGTDDKLGRCNLTSKMYDEILWILRYFE